MPDDQLPLLVIAGPTATGKTEVAWSLARELDGELVGADSVQVYRGFNVGSATPTAEELESIPHHLINIIDPNQDIDAMAYATMADRAIEQIAARGKLPIVVGGTGLWIRALLRGLVDVPPVDPSIRQRLEHEAATCGAPALYARLLEVDPLAATAVHPNDQLRIIRALEVHEQTGTPLGELRARHALGQPRYRAHTIVLDWPQEPHREVIAQRLERMLRAGWIDEVRGLRQRWGDEVRAFSSVGYRELLAHVRDGISLEETRRRILKSTRIYAKRQRTWFRGEPGVDWRTDRDHLLSPEARVRIAKALAR